MQSRDTSEIAEKMQIDLFRKAKLSKRISCLRSLSQTTIELSRRAISRNNLTSTEQEINIMFVDLHYGKQLANLLRIYLNQKKL